MTHEPEDPARPEPEPLPNPAPMPYSGLSQGGVGAAGFGALLLFIGLIAPNRLSDLGSVFVTGGLLLCILDVVRHIYLYGVPKR